MRQPWTDEYDEFIDWLGAPYDTDQFNAKRVTMLLGMENFGCEWFE
jgi:hypothetical protein